MMFSASLPLFTVMVSCLFVGTVVYLLRTNQPEAPTVLIWNVNAGNCRWIDSKGQVDIASPIALVRLPWVVILNLSPSNNASNRWLPIWRDQLSRDDWRRLQVLARWSKLPNTIV